MHIHKWGKWELVDFIRHHATWDETITRQIRTCVKCNKKHVQRF